ARDSAGTHAKVKSGLDGKSREMVIFGRKTQNYMRRASWRFLRKVARHKSAEYPHAAAEVLVQYGPEDEEMPVGKYGAFNRCYLLMRILYGASQRFLVSSRSLRFKLASSGSAEKPEGLREEAFADLWDEEPRAFLRILSAAKLAEAHEFALAGIKRHPETIQDASPKELLAMLKAPHPETIELSLHEIEDRFDPGDPDWDLIALLMTSDHPTARKLGERFLQQSSPIWTGQAPLIIRFLTLSDGVARSYAANILIAAPPVTDTKSALAEIFWEMLKRDIPEGSEDDLESVARVCRELLLNELSGRTDTSELLSLISKGSASAQSVAADLLAMRPEAAGALGLERLASLAVHSLAAVRGAAAKLLRAAGSYLDADPSILFVMVECDWEDTRAAALELIREKIDFADAERGFDSLVGLLDSNIVDVQEFAKQLVYDHLETIDRTKLVYRLAQHPHPNIRRFALKLAVEHLPDGAAPLRRVESLCRSALFDLWPLREEKRGVIDFLTQRGMTDQSQALIASRILSEIIPTQGRADFESAMDAIVRMKLAYPDLESCVTFHEMEAS
ncbi:MAG: hypothetical protein QF886_13575, partial [Planctomycetota bacterium]|nr:hypothetical protein [Planctomycetota bacterium]